ncbi:MAG: PHP domain-containing protein [Eubacteriales bacterium]|nr:PHP domain-containing protein [Eubacteriales bacterium]
MERQEQGFARGMPFDLHLHTTRSDATCTPGEMVRWAARLGIFCVAITDHDSVDGVPEALAEGKRLGVRVIPGVEISVNDGAELHLLGYGLRVHSGAYEELITQMRRNRSQRNRRLLERLRELNIELPEAYRPEATSGVYGRMQVARGLIAGGYAADIHDAFARFLQPGGVAYVPRQRISADHALSLILACGGRPVLAHPGRVHGWDARQLYEAVRRLSALGLAGLEVFYPTHTADQTRQYAAWATQLGLTMTYGSDCHGPQSPSPEPGYGFPSGRELPGTYDFIGELLDQQEEHG